MPEGEADSQPDAPPDATSAPPLSMAVRREMSLIALSAGVQKDTVQLRIDPRDAWVQISFALEMETPVERLDTRIEPVEPFVLVYGDIDAVGITAPKLVLSGRDDFPRNLGHLNPVRVDQPASLCLARSGLQPIYDRYGIEGIMVRLRTWMRDAMTGGLMSDGWEPVPFLATMPMRGGLIDPAAFQEIAAKRRAEIGWTSGVAIITPPAQGDYVILSPIEVSALEPSHFSALARAANDQRDAVPWLFIWSSGANPIADPVFGCWQTYRELRAGLATVGLAGPLETAIGGILANGCHCKHFPPGARTLVVLVGLWRPMALAANIFGLSDDPVARCLEIKAYTLDTTIAGNLLDDDAQVHTVVADPMPSPALFRWTTNTPKLGLAGLIGYGALGQAVADHLLRSGIEGMTCIDRDKMMPHNIARHGGELLDVYRLKVDHLERKAGALTAATHKPSIRVFRDDATRLSDSELTERLGGARLIIDATADERVRGRLTTFAQQQITRIEIFRRGRLGVQFVAGSSGNPSLLDLYYLLCREALADNAVAEWLRDEHVDFGFNSDELLFGFGCASRTTRLPNFVVAQHASAFMPTIVQGLTDGAPPGIGLNHLDSDFRPSGWRWRGAPEFVHVEPPAAPGWTVRLHPDVVASLVDWRAEALPRETGGYLYGGWDAALKRITAVVASPLPPGSTATSGALTLGSAGSTSLERRLARRTRGRVGLCGTWHSHPGTSAAMSGKDSATMRGFSTVDGENGIPTLIVIVAADAHLEVHLRA
jgi:hypothetical protein